MAEVDFHEFKGQKQNTKVPHQFQSTKANSGKHLVIDTSVKVLTVNHRPLVAITRAKNKINCHYHFWLKETPMDLPRKS